MAAYDNLRAVIAANVYQNNNNEVTADMVKAAMNAMVASLGAEFQFGGVAEPDDNPGTPDYKVAYLAATPGTYTDFGGIVVADGEVVNLKWDGTSWSKEATGAATKAAVDAAEAEIAEQWNCAGLFGIVDGAFNLSNVFITNFSGVPASSYIYPVFGIRRIKVKSMTSGNNRLWFVKSYPAIGSAADFCASTPAAIDFSSGTFDVPADAKYVVLGRVYASTGVVHRFPEIYVYGVGAEHYRTRQDVRAFSNLAFNDSDNGGCLISDATRIVTNPIWNRGIVRITAQFGFRIEKIIYYNGQGIAGVEIIERNSAIVGCSETCGMLPQRGEFDKFVVQLYASDGSSVDASSVSQMNVVGISTDDSALQGLQYIGANLSSDNLLLSSAAVWNYIDADEIDINIKFAQESGICVRVVGYEKVGRTNVAFGMFADPSYFGNDKTDIPSGVCVSCNLQKGKTYMGHDGAVHTLDFVVLRFIKNDGTVPTVNDILASVVINEIQCKFSELARAENEREVFFGGLKATDNYVVRCDDFVIPRECGTFRVLLPHYMSFEWDAGYNSNSNMIAYTISGSSTLLSGDNVRYITNARLKPLHRMKFKIIGSNRNLPVAYVNALIAAGRIKVYITEDAAGVVDRNYNGERYVNALESASGRQYGLRDLPMLVHIGDIHSDSTRFKAAFDYAKHLRAHAFIHTGDAPARSYADSGVDFVKDIDGVAQPAPLDANAIPFMNVIGNHDVWNCGDYSNVINSLIAPFSDKYGYNRLAGKSYYYKDFQIPAPRNQSSSVVVYTHIRMIVLDICEGLSVQNKWNISSEQFEWFISLLENMPSGYGVIVALHCPPDTLVKPSEISQVVKYHSDTFVCVDQFKQYAEGGAANPAGLVSYGFIGNPIVKIIDAFISRAAVTGQYQPDSAQEQEISYSADFTGVPSSCEFLAYICGHTHRDYVCYAQHAENLQLVLCVTCGTGVYGPYENVQGANSSDVPRGTIGATQDAFNAYVIDRDCGRIGIARVGSDVVCDGSKRAIQWLNYRELVKFQLNGIECFAVKGETWDTYIGNNADFKNAYLQDFYVQTGLSLSRRQDTSIQVGNAAVKLGGNPVYSADIIQEGQYTY